LVREKLGRYELLGKLATGGMAEIQLARLLGPLGFERQVVIKRILPELARSERFARMFLAEARTVAEINHPNVVQIHELCAEGSELYMVMEYLEGESVAGILGKLWREGRVMDDACAALIAASACAGLHAAHELVGTDGRPLGLVHRDISPSNLFVTYDGQVKVLDFGIAKAERGAPQTDAGTVKGKKPYMSPEQALAQPLDRRSDLFSLGIVLFEMCSLRRLFQRDNPLLVYRAICEEPIPSLADVRGRSSELDRICGQALARSPGARYGTAQAMRRDLLAAARASEGGEPEERLAAMMAELFPDRKRAKIALRSQLEHGLPITMAHDVGSELGASITSVTGHSRRRAGASFTRARQLVIVAAVALGSAGAYAGLSTRTGAARPLPISAPTPTVAPPTVTSARVRSPLARQVTALVPGAAPRRTSLAAKTRAIASGNSAHASPSTATSTVASSATSPAQAPAFRRFD
jgi:hypothetical protein